MCAFAVFFRFLNNFFFKFHTDQTIENLVMRNVLNFIASVEVRYITTHRQLDWLIIIELLRELSLLTIFPFSIIIVVQTHFFYI